MNWKPFYLLTVHVTINGKGGRIEREETFLTTRPPVEVHRDNILADRKHNAENLNSLMTSSITAFGEVSPEQAKHYGFSDDGTLPDNWEASE